MYLSYCKHVTIVLQTCTLLYTVPEHPLLYVLCTLYIVQCTSTFYIVHKHLLYKHAPILLFTSTYNYVHMYLLYFIISVVTPIY